MKRLISILIAGVVLTFFSTPIQTLAISPEQKSVIQSGVRYFNTADDSNVCSPVSSGLDQFLKAIAAHESGGNITAKNPNGSASGKYQYIDPTWKSKSQQYYPPGLQYPSAYLAPEPVQDAVAYLEFTDLWRQFNGDIIIMAAIHYLGHKPTEAELNAVPEPGAGNTETVRQFGETLIDIMQKGEYRGVKLSDIPIREAEAPDFQTWLTKIGGAILEGGQSTPQCGVGVPADGFVFYSQYDPKWADHPYGSSTIATSGCGPSSVAMIVATLIDNSTTPVEVADFGTSNGAYIPGQGSSWQKMLVEGPQNWGLSSVHLGKDINRAIEILKEGGLVLASGQGPVPFTTGGHIIVIRGVDSSGKLLLGDPAHEEANSQAYEATELMKSIRGLWGVTK